VSLKLWEFLGFFRDRLYCKMCKYWTFCRTTMNLHVEKKHGQVGAGGTEPLGLFSKRVELLEQPLACRCGFSSNNPFEIGKSTFVPCNQKANTFGF